MQAVKRISHDAGGSFSKSELVDLVSPSPCHIHRIAPRASRPMDFFTEIIKDHIVIQRAAVIIANDSVEDLEQSEHANVESSFLPHFALDTFREQLTNFQNTAWNGPLALKRWRAAANQ